MIYLATDHRGFKLKEKIKIWLKEWRYEYEDMGAFEYNEDDDYPDFISKAAENVSADPDNAEAIILGGSGQGEAISANKFKGVRAVVFYGGVEDIIKLTKEHNNANILSLGASFIDDILAKSMIRLWLDTSFSDDERHKRRIDKIKALENG
jgi:ribose 5-phosphate isomerase B